MLGEQFANDPIGSGRRRIHHRKCASDTLAFAASALLNELPPSMPQHFAVGPLASHTANRLITDSEAAISPVGDLGLGFGPADLLEVLRDVDEDDLGFDADELLLNDLDVDGEAEEEHGITPPTLSVLPATGYGRGFGIAAADVGAPPTALSRPSHGAIGDVVMSMGPLTAPATAAAPANPAAAVAAEMPTALLQQHQYQAPGMRRGAASFTAGSDKGDWQGHGASSTAAVAPLVAAVSSRHVRNPSDPLMGMSSPVLLDKPLSEFAGQTRANALDPSQLDPKRAKRIIANRQSAHRSRMKKLQVIHDLEQQVAAARAASDAVRQQVAAAAGRRRELLVATLEAHSVLAEVRREMAAAAAVQAALVSELKSLGVDVDGDSAIMERAPGEVGGPLDTAARCQGGAGVAETVMAEAAGPAGDGTVAEAEAPTQVLRPALHKLGDPTQTHAATSASAAAAAGPRSSGCGGSGGASVLPHLVSGLAASVASCSGLLAATDAASISEPAQEAVCSLDCGGGGNLGCAVVGDTPVGSTTSSLLLVGGPMDPIQIQSLQAPTAPYAPFSGLCPLTSGMHPLPLQVATAADVMRYPGHTPQPRLQQHQQQQQVPLLHRGFLSAAGLQPQQEPPQQLLLPPHHHHQHSQRPSHRRHMSAGCAMEMTHHQQQEQQQPPPAPLFGTGVGSTEGTSPPSPPLLPLVEPEAQDAAATAAVVRRGQAASRPGPCTSRSSSSRSTIAVTATADMEVTPQAGPGAKLQPSLPNLRVRLSSSSAHVLPSRASAPAAAAAAAATVTAGAGSPMGAGPAAAAAVAFTAATTAGVVAPAEPGFAARCFGPGTAGCSGGGRGGGTLGLRGVEVSPVATMAAEGRGLFERDGERDSESDGSPMALDGVEREEELEGVATAMLGVEDFLVKDEPSAGLGGGGGVRMMIDAIDTN